MRVLFASFHNILDPSNGAARSARDRLALLTQVGTECRAVCGPLMDTQPLSRAWLARWGGGGVTDDPSSEAHASGWLDCMDRGVPIRVLADESCAPGLPDASNRRLQGEFLEGAAAAVEECQPDVLLTFGGGWVHRELHRCAAARSIPIIFLLSNHSYVQHGFFDGLRVLVPSAYLARFYRDAIGLEATVLPSIVDPEPLALDAWRPESVLFVNPVPHKGSFWAARIWLEVVGRVPSARLVTVESQPDRPFLRFARSLGLGESVASVGMTDDPRDFYRTARVVLMPSLTESSGRVATEAMLLGIPLIASTRGGLPESMVHAGLGLDIPDWFTAECEFLPAASLTAAWVETLVTLLTNEHEWARERRRNLEYAKKIDPIRGAHELLRFLESVAAQA